VSQVALLDSMAQQAAAQSAEILAEGRREAAALLDQARAKAAEHREAVWRSVHAEESQRDRMARQAAQVEADKGRVAARDRAVKDVMGLVHQHIERLAAGPEFPAILERLLKEALAASTGPVIVEAPEAHVELCRNAAVRMGPDIREVVGSTRMWDGVAVWNVPRTMRITNTLTNRLVMLEGRAVKHIVSRLFRHRDT
jgi:vacuolar-type H+-ATPase subunit E/Vma4